MTAYYVASGITGTIGIIFWFIRNSSIKKLQNMIDTPTSTVKQLEDRLHHSKGQNANEEYREQVEVKGKIVCEKPLIGELSKRECVYYDTKVTHEYEETYKERDSNGNSVTRRRRSSDVMTKDTRHIPFYLEDETGKILIEGEGADMDTVQVVNKLERHPRNNNLAMGNMVLDLARVITNQSRNRTIGYRLKESIVPLDKKLYILGEVSSNDKTLSIRKPVASGSPFIISTKSEEQLIRSQQSTAKWMAIIAYVFFIASATLILIALKNYS
ncbi:E3 ubiquitin ligase family protein [Candidatus Uabimicrobium sp. HlEnr_7]|uniref:E3 ubiquitin ligase family protein n=1 Tax=Candidatus Uabimicrobium helgolandensis TaxID=3095367 RepID=UPI0035591C99